MGEKKVVTLWENVTFGQNSTNHERAALWLAAAAAFLPDQIWICCEAAFLLCFHISSSRWCRLRSPDENVKQTFSFSCMKTSWNQSEKCTTNSFFSWLSDGTGLSLHALKVFSFVISVCLCVCVSLQHFLCKSPPYKDTWSSDSRKIFVQMFLSRQSKPLCSLRFLQMFDRDFLFSRANMSNKPFVDSPGLHQVTTRQTNDCFCQKGWEPRTKAIPSAWGLGQASASTFEGHSIQMMEG